MWLIVDPGVFFGFYDGSVLNMWSYCSGGQNAFVVSMLIFNSKGTQSKTLSSFIIYPTIFLTQNALSVFYFTGNASTGITTTK